MISIFSFQTPATILDKRNVAANVHANSNIEACTANISLCAWPTNHYDDRIYHSNTLTLYYTLTIRSQY